MKTTTTISIDGDIKEKAMLIIQKNMHSNLSHEINQFLKKIIEKKPGEK